MFPFIYFFEEKEFDNFFQRLVYTKFCMGQIKHTMHFISVVHFIMHHVRKVYTHFGIVMVRLWKETGSTVLFITHNIEEAVYLAERILILSNKPTTIKEDFKVDLPRPRDVTSPEFTKIRQYVTDQIKWW